MNDALGSLESANRLLGDRAALAERMVEDGYLFFRAIAKDAVSGVADRCVDELRRQGIAEGDERSNWTGVDLHRLDEQSLHDAARYDEFWHSPTMMELFEEVLGEPAYVFKQTQVRVMVPTYERFDTPPHQDGSYIDNDVFRTVWVPLVDMDADMGGVALAGESQRHGLRQHVKTEKRSFTGRFHTSGVPVDEIQEPFLTAPFERGDVLIFHCYMIHRSVPNRSKQNLLRMSIDSRIQPAATPRGYIATHTALEIQRAAAEQGGFKWGVQQDANPLAGSTAEGEDHQQGPARPTD